MHTHSQKGRLFKRFFTLFILIVSVLFATALFSREAKAVSVSALPDILWCPTPNMAVFKLQGLTTLVEYRLDLICVGGGCAPGDTVELSDGPFVAVVTAYNLPYTFAIDDDPSCLGSGKSIDAGIYSVELCWGAGFDTCEKNVVTFLEGVPNDGVCDSYIDLYQNSCSTDLNLDYTFIWYPESRCNYWDAVVTIQAVDAEGGLVGATLNNVPPFDCRFEVGNCEDNNAFTTGITGDLDGLEGSVTVSSQITYTAKPIIGSEQNWIYGESNTCAVTGDPDDPPPPPPETCADEDPDEPWGCGVDLAVDSISCTQDDGNLVRATMSNWLDGGLLGFGCVYNDIVLSFSAVGYETQTVNISPCQRMLGIGDCDDEEHTEQWVTFSPQITDEDYDINVTATLDFTAKKQLPVLGAKCPAQRSDGPAICNLYATPCTGADEVCDDTLPCCNVPTYMCVDEDGDGTSNCTLDTTPPPIPPPDPDIEPSDPPEVPEYTGPILENFDDLIRVLFGLMMPVAIGVIGIPLLAINGYKLMTSQGDPGKVRDAKEGLTSAIIGLVFALLALSVLRIIVETFFEEGVFSP